MITDRSLIYLDYNASTPIAPQVAEVIARFLPAVPQTGGRVPEGGLTAGWLGNPSSSHWAGVLAKATGELARCQVAGLLGCSAEEIVFTSGGSESNNHAIKGTFFALQSRGNHIITSQVEHPSIRQPCRFLETLGAKVTFVPVDGYGMVDPDDVRKCITDKTILISIMHANNEVGTIQPLAEISTIACERGILFHTDAAQSVGKIPANVEKLGVDLLSVAGHKLYAPKGVGCLYIRKGVRIEPLIHGAGQESGRRAGTENVLLNAALGAACELASGWIGKTKTCKLRDLFLEMLSEEFGDRIVLNGHPVERLPNTLHVSFLGQSGAQILSRMEDVAASTGSACHSGQVRLSPVLEAMGVSPEAGLGAIRFSLGRETTKGEIVEVVRRLKRIVSS
ncbi:MAG: cysteine desulfurase family protein [bacterium]